ncbi:MAG TPA: MxaH protein [Methylocella sp.]|nr:MxaH protein [Methylocella sp.]
MNIRKLPHVLVFAAVFLAGCGDSQPDNRGSETGTVTYGHSPTNLNWLGVEDRTDPALWLAGKENTARSPIAEAITQIRNALEDAGDRFLETPRMIANRTAQLSDMLARNGQSESYVDLIESFARIAEGSKEKLEYGDLCQFYYNLRHKGADKASALAVISEKYQALIRKP